MSDSLENLESTPNRVMLSGEGLENMPLQQFMTLARNLGRMGIQIEAIPEEPTPTPLEWVTDEQGDKFAVLTADNFLEFSVQKYRNKGPGRIFYNMLKLHKELNKDDTYEQFFYEDEVVTGIYAAKLPEMMRTTPKKRPLKTKLSSFPILKDYIAALTEVGIIEEGN